MTPAAVRASLPVPAPLAAALLAFLLHLPFVGRYDLHFQGDFAISVLISRSILEGERPIYFWGQAYLGTFGNYLTAAVFRFLGVSVPAAGLVSLAIFATGVGLATALAAQLLGARAALWAGLAAAVASPYANHYATQPYSGYETAAVLALLALAGLGLAGRLVARPLSARTAVSWLGLGFVLGLGWWTTRLFVPALAAVALAVATRGGWGWPAAAGVTLMLPGFLIGASPDLLYRLGAVRHHVSGVAAEPLFELVLAAPAQLGANLLAGLRALPAYLNGDPVARHPEGVTFIAALAAGLPPYAGPADAPGPVAAFLDRLVALATIAILLATLPSAARAWRGRQLPLLALCLIPFVHLLSIAVSGRTNGSYFEARRYWYASLLVLPVLFGNALALAAASRLAAVRVGAPLVAGVLLLGSLAAQARQLTLPDELGPFRSLVSALTADRERSVLMPAGGAWIVSALSGGRIDALGRDSRRRPQLYDALAARERVVLVLSRREDEPPDELQVETTRFVRDGPARAAAMWLLFPYRAVREE